MTSVKITYKAVMAELSSLKIVIIDKFACIFLAKLVKVY